MSVVRADAVVVGGGLAGLYAALHLPDDWEVVVVDKGAGPQTGSSPLAQGGMAVAVHPDDSPDLHAADTLRAGAGACDEDAVRVLVEQAPAALAHLVELGCAFDRAPDGSWDLNLEGGQTVARSVHRDDATGREIMRVVVAQARDRARRLTGTALELVVADGRCAGVCIATDDGPVLASGRCVLLATGGCGALYEATTNTPGSLGDGVALAFAAGAEVRDMEFVQFHPTALASGSLQRVLLTEALRGEGAVVVDASGERFLHRHHPAAELAPRDVVARAIAASNGAFLDATALGAERLERRFPNICEAVRRAGYDLARGPVPVAPAAHYFLGGVSVDAAGRTSLPGLYAAGECAASGVHGANRMAGNSLTEAVVFGRLAGLAMGAEPPAPRPLAPATQPYGVTAGPSAWTALRAAMSRGAGLVRTAAGLREASDVIASLAEADDAALRLACSCATLVCRGALERDESRGVHFRADAPAPSAAWDGGHVCFRRDAAQSI